MEQLESNKSIFAQLVKLFDYLPLRVASCILLIVFLSTVILLIVRWFKVKKELDALSRECKKILAPVKFVTFETLDPLSERMTASRLLGHHWNEFEETLIKEDSGSAVEIYNTRPLSEFLSKSSALEVGLNISSVRKIPSIITSLGLFFTFLFIVMGLLDINLEDSTKMMGGINKLVTGLSSKFTSSVLALAFAVIFSFVADNLVHGIEKRYDSLMTFLDSKFRRKTNENYLQAIAQSIQELNVSMKHFSTDLASVIKEGLTEGMRPSTDSLLSAISNLEKQKSENIADTLSKLLGEFKSSLSQSAGSEFAELGSSVTRLAGTMEESARRSESLSARIETLVGSLDSQIDKSSRMSDESVTKTQQAFESLLSAIETNTKAQKDTMTAMMKDIVDSTSDATRGIVKDVGSIAEQNRNLMGDFAILTDSAKASVTKYQEVVKSTTNLIVTASSVTDSVSQNLTKLATLESNMQDLTAKFMAESRSLLDIQQRNASGVERYQQVFKEVEAGLATVLRQISENMSRYNDLTKTGLEGYLKQYDESLSKATSKLSTTVKDLDDALDGLAETLSKGPSA